MLAWPCDTAVQLQNTEIVCRLERPHVPIGEPTEKRVNCIYIGAVGNCPTACGIGFSK
jgi:hypothetical protein